MSSALPNEALGIRAKGIGSSEIAAVLGISQYMTPLKLWRLKMGIDEKPEGNRFMTAGHMLESAVASYFEEVSGNRIIKKSEDWYAYVHPEHSYIIASPDREYFGKDGGRFICECKTTQKQIDKDDIPLEWFAQLQYQLGTGIAAGKNLKGGAIAWLQRGLDFDYIEFDFNPEFYADLVKAVSAFWNDYILANAEPPMINVEDVILKFPTSQAKSIEAGEELQNAHTKLSSVKAQIKALEKSEEDLANQVKIAMQDAELVEYAGQKLFSWKTSKAGTMVDSKKLEAEYPEVYKAVLKDKAASRPFLVN